VAVREELSSDTGYGLGPLFRMIPPLGRERILFSSQRGSMPDVFRQADDRTFVLKLLTNQQRDQFLEYVLNAGIVLEVEEGKGGSPAGKPVGEHPVIVEFEW
jgi:hypothetical protein